MLTESSEILEKLENFYKFPLDEFQRDATRVLIDGHSLVVSAPTGSGKTLIGETAIMNALMRGEKSDIYNPAESAVEPKVERVFEEVWQKESGIENRRRGSKRRKSGSYGDDDRNSKEYVVFKRGWRRDG